VGGGGGEVEGERRGGGEENMNMNSVYRAYRIILIFRK
jgi:hypothetical protein